MFEKANVAATVRLGKIEIDLYQGTDQRFVETVLRVLGHAE